MGAPLFLYHSYLDIGTSPSRTFAASTTASGYTVERIERRLPGVPDNWWRNDPALEITANAAAIRIDFGSNRAPNTLAITGHNLGTNAAGLHINYSDTPVLFGFPYTTGISQSGFIDNDATLVWNFGTTLGSHRYWEILFDSLTTYVEIGSLALGQKLEFPEYMAPGFDPENLVLKMREQRSKSGPSANGNRVGYVSQHVELKFGVPLDRTSFHDWGGTTNWRAFLRQYWQRGTPWWAKWAGDYYDSATARPGWYCFPAGNDKTSAEFNSSMKRGVKFGFDVLCENYQQAA